MKAILPAIVLVIFFYSSILCQPTWEVQSSPVNENFISVCFADEFNGCVISESGSILITNDGGSSWTTQSFPDFHFESVHFPTVDNGYIVGWHIEAIDSSLILLTTDGGVSWSESNHPKVNRLNDVYFTSSLKGWAVGSNDELNLNECLFTSDGGLIWNAQMDIFVASAELMGVHFRDSFVGVVCGANGAFFHTNSGGQSGWAMNISMPLVNLNAVYNMGDQHGCAVGDGGTALYTVNDWYQYIDQISGTLEDLNAVHAEPDLNKLWAVGDNGVIIHCPSYLLGWTNQNSGTSENLMDICMLSESSGWAVGNGGTLIRFSSPSFIKESSVSLMKVVPNPSNGLFMLQFDKKSKIDRVEVIDIFGRLNKSSIPPVEAENLMIDISSFEYGIYFVVVYSGQHSSLQKLIYSK